MERQSALGGNVQILFLPTWLMILSYILLWPLFQVSISLIGNKISDKNFDHNRFWLKTRKWEQDGLFYIKVFKINKWKHLLPDGAKAHKKGFQKKNMQSYDTEYMKAFIAETGRAETIHWFQIIPFWVFGLWSPPFVIWVMLGYALLVNLPCILAQRYNRPRLVKGYNYLLQKQEKMRNR